MDISGISSNIDYYQANGVNSLRQQRKKDFNALSDALKSGDLNGAQQSFSAIQQLLSNSSVGQTQTGQQDAGKNPFSVDISTLGQALQSGDLTGAQNDFAQLQKDMQSVGKGGHHHHHKAAAGSNTTTTQQDSNQSSFAADFNALGQALQSGDLANAKNDFSQLQKDIESIGKRRRNPYNNNVSIGAQNTDNTTSNSSINFDQILNSVNTQDASTTGTSSSNFAFEQFLSTITAIQNSSGSNNSNSLTKSSIGGNVNISA